MCGLNFIESVIINYFQFKNSQNNDTKNTIKKVRLISNILFYISIKKTYNHNEGW